MEEEGRIKKKRRRKREIDGNYVKKSMIKKSQ